MEGKVELKQLLKSTLKSWGINIVPQDLETFVERLRPFIEQRIKAEVSIAIRQYMKHGEAGEEWKKG